MTTPQEPTLSPRKQALLVRIREQAERMGGTMYAQMYVHAVQEKMLYGQSNLFDFMENLEHIPVSMEEFLDGSDFLGATDLSIWPEVRRTAIELNQDWWKGIGRGGYEEAVFMGATGTAKTTLSIIDTLYAVYLLHCLQNPQRWYGLSSATTIVLAFLAAKPHVMRKVVYMPARKYLEAMPWFQRNYMPDRLTTSEMIFEEKNIRVVPAGGDEDAVIGEACIHAVIDEINFMNVVMKSKKAEAGTGRSGVYNQAAQVHSTLTRRKKSRFLRPGPTIGKVISSSSTRYRGDFTDKRRDEVRKDGGKSIHCYIYNRRQYDVLPASRFSGKKFRLMIANEVQHDTRVLADDEVIDIPGVWIEEVPIEYLGDFNSTGIYDALRDVMGISSNVISPFIKSRHKIYEAAELGVERGLESFLEKDHVVLGVDGMLRVKPGHYCANPSRPRFIHIDLSLTGDRLGIAMVAFAGMVDVKRLGDSQNDPIKERLPVGIVEMAASIEPDANNEIDIAEVRAFAQSLQKHHGYPIKGVSYDGFQSRESIQQWRKAGWRAREISMDRSSTPHKQARDAMYDGRLILLNDPELIGEYIDLEYDSTKDKVDHPVTGSKDVADAVTGAYTNMLERRSTWFSVGDGDYSDDMEGRMEDRERMDAPRN